MVQKYMKKLRSLSVYANALMEYSYGFWLQPKIVAALLQSLPRSCANIELDTNGMEKYEKNDPCHHCLKLQALLPQMRHVKLRMQSFCRQLVSDPDSSRTTRAVNLRTFTLSEFPRDMRGSHQPFKNCAIRSEYPLEVLFPPVPDLVSTLVSAVKQNSFPQAVSVSVLQQADLSPEDPESDDFEDLMVNYPTYKKTIIIRDCLHDRTIPLPMNAASSVTFSIFDSQARVHVGEWAAAVLRIESGIWREAAAYPARLPFDDAPDVLFRELPGFELVEKWSKVPKVIPTHAVWEADEHDVPVLRRVVELEGATSVVMREKLPKGTPPARKYKA